MKRHLLFVCTANQQRSPTAATLFEAHPDYEAKSCGIHPLSPNPIREGLIHWADEILCMEPLHQAAILEQFPDTDPAKIRVLNIPDIYERYDPELIELLYERLSDLI